MIDIIELIGNVLGAPAWDEHAMKSVKCIRIWEVYGNLHVDVKVMKEYGTLY